MKELKDELINTITDTMPVQDAKGVEEAINAHNQMQVVLMIMAGGEMKINEINYELLRMAHVRGQSKVQSQVKASERILVYLHSNLNKRLSRKSLWNAAKVVIDDKVALAYQDHLALAAVADDVSRVAFEQFKFKTIAFCGRYRQTEQVKNKIFVKN